MKRIIAVLAFISIAYSLRAAEFKLAALPDPVANNAVALLKYRGEWLLFSFMGVGSKKTWEGVTNAAYYLDPDWDKWYPLRPVPGTAGRIAASAVGARDHVFLLGGYVVDAQDREMVVPDVNVYEPLTERWLRGDDLPVAVAGSVVGVYRDRYIYVVGGISNAGIAPDVQVYDSEKSKWLRATTLPGTPVFGHAGALLDDTIVYVDGAYKNPPRPSRSSSPRTSVGWARSIATTLRKIEWSKLPSHPGTARFGIAAGASEKDRKVYFTGGSDAPHDYAGVGFDGKPAEPSPTTFAFDLRSGKWEMVNDNTPNPTMDSRGILAIRAGLVIAGGMRKGQQPAKQLTVLPVEPKTK